MLRRVSTVLVKTLILSLSLPSVLLNTVHFMHYAMAAYGWPMYVFHNKSSVCRAVCSLCCCPPCCSSTTSNTTEDNCCSCNMAAVRQVEERLT